MLVLITGGAGFIGSHTAEALIRKGHRVRILDCLDPQVHGPTAVFPSYLPREAECRRGDVRDLQAVSDALEGVQAVYHFAAHTGTGQSMYEVRKYIDVNCCGTATLLEALLSRRQPLQRLVLSSSRAVYGEGAHHCPSCGPVTPPSRGIEDLRAGSFACHCPSCGAQTEPLATGEKTPTSPVSIYGWTKLHQENLCQLIAAVYGIPLTILRYFNVFGSRQSLSNPYTGIITTFYRRLASRTPLHLYENGRPLRDFVHVHDVVAANLAALDQTTATTTIANVGSGEAVTIESLARTLAQAMKSPLSTVDQGEFRVGDIYACFADIQSAAATLSYRPRVSLTDGLREFCRWASSQKDSADKDVSAELARQGLLGRASAKRAA